MLKSLITLALLFVVDVGLCHDRALWRQPSFCIVLRVFAALLQLGLPAGP